MSEITIQATCPKCGEELQLQAEIPNYTTPQVRGKLEPVGCIWHYSISTTAIENFVAEKSKKYCPTAKVVVVPKYIERKFKDNNGPHHSYASLRIAFSEEVVERKEDLGFYGKIGESNLSPRIQPSIFQNLVKKYGYTVKEIDAWAKSYKNMEELEERFGITETYLDDLKRYATPRLIESNDSNKWIIFSAAPEAVISDMLIEQQTNEPVGKIEIVDIIPISKENVKFEVYVHPKVTVYSENPHVRQILMGTEKPKK